MRIGERSTGSLGRGGYGLEGRERCGRIQVHEVKEIWVEGASVVGAVGGWNGAGSQPGDVACSGI